MDSFAHGVRMKYLTPEGLVSQEAKLALASCFDAHRVSTDASERQNAEMSAAVPVRSGGRDFENHSRESVLKQTRVIHLRRGGADPKRPPDLALALAPTACITSPLLASLPANVDAHGRASLPVCDQPLAEAVGAVGAAAILAAPGAGVVVAVGEAGHRPLSDDALCHSVQTVLAGVDSQLAVAKAEEITPGRRRGLSPYMLFVNQLLRAGKETSGNRSLTAAEQEVIRMQARVRWDAMEDGRAAWESMYRQWQNTPAPVVPQKAVEYRAIWGGGCLASPLSPTEMQQFHRRVGWPSDVEVSNAKPSYISEDRTIHFESDSSYNLHGCLNSARAICMSSLREEREKFTMIEAGMNDWLGFLPRTEAESGDVMVMLQCVCIDGSISRRLGWA